MTQTHTQPQHAKAAAAELLRGLDGILPGLRDLYKDLHAHPELSFQEVRTARIVAERMRAAGWDVTEGLGGPADLPGTGVVGVLRGGLDDATEGPVILLRADMDALPVREETGLPYASTVTATERDGTEVPVMHACGHDVHVACLLGATELLAANRDAWGGTVIAVFQPAEEVGGAPHLIEDGFLDRFPRPEVCLGQHVGPAPAGLVGTRPGAVMSACDTLRVRVFGRGGHGSMPEATIDPVVIAARTVVTLQTIVSREISPSDAAVVTVGYMHAGAKANIIPAEARIDLSVRSLTPDVRAHLLKSIERIVKAEALAGGATREPTIERIDGANAMVNDADLTRRLAGVLERELGKERVVDLPAQMASEDFSLFPQNGIPSVMLQIGSVEPDRFAAAKAAGTQLPSLHSPLFAPDRERTIKTAIAAEMISLRELMPPKTRP